MQRRYLGFTKISANPPTRVSNTFTLATNHCLNWWMGNADMQWSAKVGREQRDTNGCVHQTCMFLFSFCFKTLNSAMNHSHLSPRIKCEFGSMFKNCRFVLHKTHISNELSMM